MKKLLLPILMALATVSTFAQPLVPLTETVNHSPYFNNPEHVVVEFDYSAGLVYSDNNHSDDENPIKFIRVSDNEILGQVYIGWKSIGTCIRCDKIGRLSFGVKHLKTEGWPDTDLLNEDTYKIVVPQGVLSNFSGDTWPSETKEYIINPKGKGATVDFGGQIGSFHIHEKQEIIVAFDSKVAKNTGDIIFRNISDDSRSITIDVNDPSVRLLESNGENPYSYLSIETPTLLSHFVENVGPNEYEIEIGTSAFIAYGQGLRSTANPNADKVSSLPFTVYPNIPNEITLDNNDVDENKPISTVVGNLSCALDHNLHYALDNHAIYAVTDNSKYPDNQFFYCHNGALKTRTTFDYETKTTYTIEVMATNVYAPITTKQEITVRINDKDPEAPQLISLAPMSSGLPPSNDTGWLTWQLVMKFHQPVVLGSGEIKVYERSGRSGILKQSFNVATDNNVVVYKDSTVLVFLDPTLKSSTDYYVTMPDGAVVGFDGFSLDTDWQFTTSKGPLEIPTGPTDIQLTSQTIYENTVGVIGTLSASDPNQINGTPFTYRFTDTQGSVDATGTFQLLKNPVNNNVSLNSLYALDYEEQSSYDVEITVEDAEGKTYNKVFTLTVLDQSNEAPIGISFQPRPLLQDGNAIGDVMGTLSTNDTQGDSHTYSLVGGAGDTDNAKFIIVGNEVKANEVFVFEDQSTFSIRVRSTDQGSLRIDEVITIEIRDQVGNPDGMHISGREAQTITTPSIADFDFSYGNAVSLASTSSADLPVKYIVNSGDGYIKEDSLIILKPGRFQVDVIQDGNIFYLSASEKITFTVSKMSQTISADPIPDKVTTDNPFELVAASSSELPLNISILSGPATFDNNMFTLTGDVGEVSLEITQDGDDYFKVAPVKSLTFDVSTVTGLFDNKENAVTIYPNPVVNVLHFSEECTYTLYNASGNVIASGVSNSVDLSTQPSGVYTMQMMHNDKVSVVKLVKN